MAASGPSTVWITRHGERQDVVDRAWFTKPQRSYDDPPLADKGRIQAKELGKRLAKEHIDHIISSPFERCVETASIISGERTEALPIKIEPGICEILYDFPPGHRSVAQYKDIFPLVDFAYIPSTSTPYQWELSAAECFQRVTGAMAKLLSRFGDDPSTSLLIVSHGAPIASMLHQLADVWSPSVNVCGLSRLERLKQRDYKVLIDYPPGYLTATKLKETYPLVDDTYQIKHTPDHGEDYDSAVLPRIKQTMDKLLSHYPGEVVLLVGHGASVAGIHDVLTGKWSYMGLCTLSKLTQQQSSAHYKREFVADDSHLSDKTNLRPW